MIDPKSPLQWQEVVDGAEACLLLDSARQYGLVTGGPAVNVDRCVKLLEKGRRHGITPNKAGVDRYIQAFAEGAHG